MSHATRPPQLVPGLPGPARRPVLVTGGTGTLGRQVVHELLESGVPARVLSRSPERVADGATVVEGDLADPFALAEAVAGTQAVIHCATDPSHPQEVDVTGTRLLCATLGEHNPDARLVHVSIIGCWDNPLPYYRAKAAAETAVTDSGRPHTIARATQFHDLVHRLLGASVAGLGIGMRGLRFAPVDADWFATRLVDLALDADAPSSTREYAGPEVLSARELSVLTAHIEGRRTPRLVGLPTVGAVLRRLAAGSNLPSGPSVRRGGATYAQWLAQRQASAG